MRGRTRIGLSAAILAGAVALCWGITYFFPDCVMTGYGEARRWVGAALFLETLPVQQPIAPDGGVCRGVLRNVHLVNAGEYFPRGVLNCEVPEDTFPEEWYSRYLNGMGEPSLWALSRSDSRAEVYRFLWLRAFHSPSAFRLVVNQDGTGVLISKRTNGHGLDVGRLLQNETLPITRYGVAHFLSRSLQLRFWDLPTGSERGGPDGARWIFEAVREGQYQVVDRWSPPASDPVYILGTTLMSDVAGVRLDPRDVY